MLCVALGCREYQKDALALQHDHEERHAQVQARRDGRYDRRLGAEAAAQLRFSEDLKKNRPLEFWSIYLACLYVFQ